MAKCLSLDLVMRVKEGTQAMDQTEKTETKRSSYKSFHI